MAPFYGWGSTASRRESFRGGSLLFTTKFPEIPGTHFINLGRMEGWVNIRATQTNSFLIGKKNQLNVKLIVFQSITFIKQ